LLSLSARLVREKSLDQPVVLQVLVHVQGVEVLGVEAGEQHVHDDGDIDLVGMGLTRLTQVDIGVLLILNALLHILTIEVESADAVVGVLEQGGGFERGERLAAAGGVPDVAVAATLVDAFHNGLHGIDLVRPHHQQLLLAGDQHHVTADHLAQGAFGEEFLGEGIEVSNLLVVFAGELVNGQEAFVGVEAEMAGVVVGEVPGVGAIADDEELDEAEQRLAVTVAGVGLVVDDLLHGPARMTAKVFSSICTAGTPLMSSITS